MRELIFRVWSKSKKVFCDYESTRDNDYDEFYGHITQIFLESLLSIKEDENYQIQQFSGVNSSSGARIYEGDIISVGGYNFLCEWKNHGFIFRGIKDKKYIISLNETCEKNMNIEILGNIFENPDLLD